MKVLVVDDSPATAELLCAYLKRWGFEPIAADCGQQAWQLIQEHPDIGLVLSDWEMPEMNGPDLCRQIRHAELGRYVYVILFTGRSEVDDLVEGLEAGADDFVRKPLIPEEVRARVQAGQRILALETHLEARNAALSDALARLDDSHSRIRRDLAAAARLQRSLLPSEESDIGHTHVTSLQLPSHFVAGDVYNYARLTPGHVAFYVIDVSGHGVQAALLSVALNRWLTPDRLLGEDGNPRPSADVVRDLNQRFQSPDDDTPYFTMVYGVMDERKDLLELVVAGHPSPIVVDARGGHRVVSLGGFPVGLLPDADWDTVIVPLRRHSDRLVIYTDGILDLLAGGNAAPDTIAQLVHTAPTAAQLRQVLLAVQPEDGAEADDMSIMIISNQGGECSP